MRKPASPFRFLGRSALLNALFLLEGGSGFLLDVTLAAAFGLSAQADALYAAWMLPQALGRGVFQSLTNSFMGLFSEKSDLNLAYRQAITVVLVLAFALATLMAATGQWWLPLTIPGAGRETLLIALPLVGWLSWSVAFLALAETQRAIFYREDKVIIPSLARLVGTGGAIGLIIFAIRQQNPLLAATSIVIGTAVEATIGFFGLRWGLGLKLQYAWPGKDDLREMRQVVGAPLVGQGIRIMAGVVERAIASYLGPGGVTIVAYANRIISTVERFVFRGIVVAAIQAYSDEAKVSMRSHLRLVIFLALPLSAVILILSQPLVTVLFNRGRFTLSDAQMLAMALQMYAPAIIGIALTRIPFGLAYARKQADTLLGFFVLVSVLHVASEAALVSVGIGLRAFGLAYTIAMVGAFVWLQSRTLIPQVQVTLSWRDSLQLVLVGAAALFGTFAGASLMHRTDANALAVLAAGSTSCVLFIILAAYLLNFEHMRELLYRFMKVQQ